MTEKDSEILEDVLERTKRKETLETEIEERTKDLKRSWLSNVPIEDHSILEKKWLTFPIRYAIIYKLMNRQTFIRRQYVYN